MKSLAAMSETTIWFAFFLVIFLIGAILALRIVGSYIRPVSHSAGDVLQSI